MPRCRPLAEPRQALAALNLPDSEK